MEIYGLKTCDTCRKARKSLPEAQFFDVREDGVPEDILTAALATFGETLLNKRSKTWRDLDEAVRVLPAHELLQSQPVVMKRPLIHRDGEFFLGWTPDVQSALGI